MSKVKTWVWILALATALALITFAILACSNDHGGSDDEDDVSYGNDLHGMYQVVVNTTYNSCPEEAPAAQNWSLNIEQSEDLSRAEVFWQKAGSGTEKTRLFTGDVFGDLIIRNAVDKTQIGDTKCMQLSIVYYRLEIDPDTAAVSGMLIDDIVYVGDACSPSTVDCRTERTLESINNPPTDDDTGAADDDTSTAA